MNINKYSEQTVLEAAEIIKAGGVVVCPTDTNYVVMTHIESQRGVERIYEMKKRDGKKPLTLLLGKVEEVDRYAYSTEEINRLINSLWPGPLTVILEKKESVPEFITCGFKTVALTLFKNEVLSEITRRVGVPVVATSANLSGTGIVPHVEKAIDHLGKSVDLIIDYGASAINASSTIIDFTFDKPMLAREGTYTIEQIAPYVSSVKADIPEYSRLIQERIRLQLG